MQVFAEASKKLRPIVLLVMQGGHHLNLYRNLFVLCQDVSWICFLPEIQKVSRDVVEELYDNFGVQFFTDRQTAIAHFGTIDAVITTFAVPHRAHTPHLRFVALAYELGIPVFELQHGLFQLGISSSEASPFVGSGISGALNGLPVPNMTDRKLRWSGEGAIGYPPFAESVYEDSSRLRCAGDHTLILTNLHWNILSEEDVGHICDMIVKAVVSLPEISFMMVPHPSELDKPHLKRLRARLQSANAQNIRIIRPDSADEMSDLIKSSRMALSTVSTVLLDLEMYEVPTLIMAGRRQHRLIESFQSCHLVVGKEGLVQDIKDIYYGHLQPYLRTGMLEPFHASILQENILTAIRKIPMRAETYVPIINKYVG
ncbi:hypothetical protein AB1J06_15340 [Agrobacterium tumefaciens]|uniref:hypothetical protein n=1 Tax=Agrobacterium tumefaciens TaxID=358 RepID=UPI00345A638D